MSRGTECPYCGEGVEINHDDGYGYNEEIDLIQPQVRAMLEAPGFYIGGDSNNPEMNVPLVSNKRRVFNEYNALKRQKRALLAGVGLIETDKDGDGFICREAMEQVREAIAQAKEGAGQ